MSNYKHLVFFNNKQEIWYEKQGTPGDGKATDILVISEAIDIFF